jgi:hypothetical protein
MAITAEDGVGTRQLQAQSASSQRSLPVDEPTTERSIISAVIYLLGACALLGLAGVIGLIATEADPSNLAALTALVGPAIGGLASILATTRTSPPASSQNHVGNR